MRTPALRTLILTVALLAPVATAHASSPPAPPGCGALTTTSQAATGLPLAIPDNGVVSSSIVIPASANTIYDVDVATTITHTKSDDLDITLTSPAGSVVTLTTDNGGSFNNVFNGTTWDDDANPGNPVPYASNPGLVTDHNYTADGVVTPLAPEEGLGSLTGQPVGGTWTLTISDDTPTNTGSLNAWSLTINGSPVSIDGPGQLSQGSQGTAQAISLAGTPTITSTLTITGAAPYATLVAPITLLRHSFDADLDITLTSPAGTVVTLTTDNGGMFNDAFNGTTWFDRGNPGGPLPYSFNPGMVTDQQYAGDGVSPTLSPEEPLSAFMGENPNGTWTLTVSDDSSGDGGSLDGWQLFALSTTCNDLATSTAVSRNVVVAGDPLAYTVTSVNRSTAALSNATVTLPLPAGVNLAAFTAPAGWTCSAPAVGANGTLSCTRASVPAGSTTTFTVDATPTTAAIGVITATGSGVLAVPDLIPADDSQQIQSTVISPPATPANPGPVPNCSTATTTTAGTTDDVAIPAGPATVSSTVAVAGAQPYLSDLDLFTKIPHSFPDDLDVTLTSPAGTVVTLTTDNGGSADNVFNGTTWDDDANPGSPVPYTANLGLVTDRPYVDGEVSGRIAPEEPFAAFIGENPNGTWTLTVSDDAGGDAGTIDEWSLSLSGVPSAPPETAGTASNTTDVPVGTLAAQASTIEVSGAGSYITDVDAITKLLHNSPDQVDMVLRSPQGTEVTLTTDNGGGSDNVFNGTTFDDRANPGGQVPYTSNDGLVTDRAYASGVVAPSVTPEEALGAFIGENPNGTWTLLVSDDVPSSTPGTLDEWTLNFKTGACAPPPPVNPPVQPPVNPPVAKAASLTKLKLTPSTFRAATSGGSIAAKKKPKKPPVGTRVSFRLDKAATVTFTVQRVTTGRKSGKKCVASNRKNRKAKKCTLLVAVKGSFATTAKTGTSTVKFSGRLSGKKLPAGSYRLRAVAAVGKLKSKTLEASFTVAKG